ncbi:MAG: LOG family protein [Chloroflexota bacterium]|nr:LOG family protein [Chloroflexota bacterium]
MGENSVCTVAVFGGSRVQPGSAEYVEAYAVGRLLARVGFVVMNGGYAGTMEASARGAKENGGRAIGVLSDEFARLAPNAYLDETVRSEDLFARIREMQQRADGFIVLKGSMGTLAELALVWNLSKISANHRKPIILLGEAWASVLRAWREHLAVSDEEARLLHIVAKPEEAVSKLVQELRG